MAEQRRFGVLSSCLMIAWVLAIGSADDNAPEKGQKGMRVSKIRYNTESLSIFSHLFMI